MRVDELRRTARVPLSVRERLGIPIPVDVRFGMDPPPDPLDQPGGYRYEIPENDRVIFETAVADAKSGDFQRQAAARFALTSALRAVPGFGPLLSIGGRLIMNLLGFGLAATSQGGSGASFSGVDRAFAGSDAWPQEVRSSVTRAKWQVVGGTAYVEMVAASSVAAWESGLNSQGQRYWRAISGEIGGDGIGTTTPINILVTQEAKPTVPTTFTWTQQFACNPATSYRFFAKENIEPPGPNGDYLGNGAIDTTKHYFGPDPLSCAEGTLYEENFEGTLEELEPLGNLDPAGSDLTPEETRQLIDEIKNSPWNKEYGPPPAPEPAPVQPPAPVGPPHPRNPDWPCGGGGLPGGPGSPGGGDIPGGPGGSGPGGGGLPGPPPGGPLPQIPGGPGRINVPGGPGPGRIEMPPFPCDDARYFPGAPVDVQVGEKTRKGRIGASDCENGTIIPEFPPFGDESFTKPWCRKNILVVDAVKELAAELGMANASWAVDPDCRERWTGCFPKGSSKFDAMWKLADMCGYDVFPPGEEIGPMKPLPVYHGPYHEARDFWGYSTQKDGLDIPSHVEVYKPNVQGRRGFSIVLPVVTPYNLGESKFFSTAVGPGVTRNMAYNMALKYKRAFEIRAIAHAVIIPYNDRIDKRHQIRLQYPSQGFTERSMVVSYEHEVDMESGAVTKLVVSELSRSTYPKRNDSFAVAWGGSLEAGIRIPRTVDNR